MAPWIRASNCIRLKPALVTVLHISVFVLTTTESIQRAHTSAIELTGSCIPILVNSRHLAILTAHYTVRVVYLHGSQGPRPR